MAPFIRLAATEGEADATQLSVQASETTIATEHNISALADDSEHSSQPSDTSEASQTSRGSHWQPWQDRLLVAEAHHVRPWEKLRDADSILAWEDVASGICQASLETPFQVELVRSGEACKARLQRLIQAHKVRRKLTVSPIRLTK